jgi:hypothetical protein
MIEIITLSASILVVAFNFGYVFKSLRDKPTKTNVYDIIKTEIKNHNDTCRYYPETAGVQNAQCLKDLKITVDKIETKVDRILDKIN